MLREATHNSDQQCPIANLTFIFLTIADVCIPKAQGKYIARRNPWFIGDCNEANAKRKRDMCYFEHALNSSYLDAFKSVEFRLVLLVARFVKRHPVWMVREVEAFFPTEYVYCRYFLNFHWFPPQRQIDHFLLATQPHVYQRSWKNYYIPKLY